MPRGTIRRFVNYRSQWTRAQQICVIREFQLSCWEFPIQGKVAARFIILKDGIAKYAVCKASVYIPCYLCNSRNKHIPRLLACISIILFHFAFRWWCLHKFSTLVLFFCALTIANFESVVGTCEFDRNFPKICRRVKRNSRRFPLLSAKSDIVHTNGR